MSHSNLTRWIEDADARTFVEAASFERGLNVSESHYLHLGETIAKIPSWLRHSVSRETLGAIGCHAVAYVRRPRH